MLTKDDIDKAVIEGVKATIWAIILFSVAGLLVATMIFLMHH